MSDTICVFHGNCADGFTAAWAVYKSLGPDIEYFPGVYGKPPPDVKGKHVIMVDFSYKRPVLEGMAQSARSILVLDHHKTAQNDLESFGLGSRPDRTWAEWQELLSSARAAGYGEKSAYESGNIASLFDTERSGAGITWDYFHPGKKRPPLIDYVEDRDLWKFKMEASREVNAYIFAHEYTFLNWDVLAEEIYSRVAVAVTGGRAIEKKHHKDVKELVAVCKRRMIIDGIVIWGASIPFTHTSDAGHLMSEIDWFAACYWDTPEGRVFSLRSAEPSKSNPLGGHDVSEIAKKYGGGGHKRAAGFTVPFSRIGEFEL